MAETVIVHRPIHGTVLLSLVVLTIVLFSALAFVSGSTSPAVNVTSGCNTLTPGPVPLVGQSGAIRFNCNTKPALTAIGTATPSFNLAATGYASLAIVLHSSQGCSQARTMKSGIAVSFGSARNDYDYCAIFLNPSVVKLGSFKVTWTVGRA